MPFSLELEPASSPPQLDEIRPNLDLPARGEHLPDLTFFSPRSPARPSSWSRQMPVICPCLVSCREVGDEVEILHVGPCSFQ
jgi:hypothetical protein